MSTKSTLLSLLFILFISTQTKANEYNDVVFDAQTTVTFQYTSLPLNQATAVSLTGSIRNVGTGILNLVNLQADVYDSTNALVYSASGTAVASLAISAVTNFTIAPWTPSTTGTYTVRFYPLLSQPDIINTNDTVTRSISITDSTMARDNGDVIGSLGIGAGNGGYLGQLFTINEPIYLSSITAGYVRGYTGTKYAATLWSTSGGKPNALLASTDTLLYPSDSALLTTMPMHNGPVLLSAGLYFIAAVEFDSTVALAYTSQVFTSNTVFVNWPTSPYGGWAPVENFGASFSHSYLLRMNLNPPGSLPVQLVSLTGIKTSTGNKLNWQVAEQINVKAYTVGRSSDGSRFESIGTVAASAQQNNYQFTDPRPLTGINFYRLTVEDYNKQTYSSIIRINNNIKTTLTLSPNPAKDKVQLQSTDAALLNTKATLTSMDGKILQQLQINQLPYQVDVSKLAKGVYLLHLQDNTVLKIMKD